MQSPYYSLFARYLDNTEGSAILGRWCAIAAATTVLGRNCWIDLGHKRIYPNMYILFVGAAGSRKSTAMKIARELVRDSGYSPSMFSATHSSRESYFDDLSSTTPEAIKAELEAQECGVGTFSKDDWQNISTQNWIFNDEFAQFIGHNNGAFCTALSDMWDYSGIYSYRARHSKSVKIVNPHISIFGGLTHDHFQDCFPEKIWKQGFGSRTILVHAGERRQKLFDPPKPNAAIAASIAEILKGLRTGFTASMTLAPKAKELLRTIYETEDEYRPADIRLADYNARRYTQLLKLCVLHAALDARSEINFDDVLLGNTILSYTESKMSDALGQYGISKNAQAAQQVMDCIYRSETPLKLLDIFKQTAVYFSKPDELVEVLTKLVAAGKVGTVDSIINGIKSVSYIPNRLDVRLLRSPHINLNLLEEAAQ